MVPGIDRRVQSPRGGRREHFTLTEPVLPMRATRQGMRRPATKRSAYPSAAARCDNPAPSQLRETRALTIGSVAAQRLLDEEPGLTGVVGTNGPDGIPHLVPVWYRWDGRAVHVWTLGSRIWVENLRRDPRAGFSVQEEPFPRRAVVIKGHAEVVTGDEAEIDEEILRITRRYVDVSDEEAYIRQNRGLRTIVSINADSLLYRRAPELEK